MVFEGLVPGVEHGNDPNRSAKASSAKLKERFTNRFEQKS